MISKKTVEDLLFRVYTSKKGDRVIVLLPGSNYIYPIELHNCVKQIRTFKELFGEIK